MRFTGLVVALASVAAGLVVSSAPATADSDRGGRPDRGWFTAWAQSQQNLAPTTLTNQSVRMITHLSQGGDAVRVRLQNQFGTAPITIDSAAVARAGAGADLVAGTSQALTFGGRRSVTIPAGGEVWSDHTGLVTRPQDDIAVSVYVAGTLVPGQHVSAFRDNYLTPPGAGDQVGAESGAAYTRTVGATYLVSAVDVHNPRLRGTVVAFGSSVVDGTGSTHCGPGCTETGTNRRWTDVLARRVAAELPPDQQLAVVNAGIGGTASSAACPNAPASAAGLDALARLDRDVLALHGVVGVIYYYGTNDLAYGCTAAPVLDSYRAVFQRLRAAGIRVYVTPITPRPGYSDQNNRDRHEVGTFVGKWNSCGGTCDGVVDFDQVLRDPLRPNSINPAYDTGDGVHANIAGQQALGDYVSLPMLVPAGPR
ncbi:GDSL-type esterase/lipase family protein [Goodfellowiella coeruleoviolacea]|nr:GDSL-type esterase/lipase family protein [Goodfellowiella coeruleoviolacea]